MKFSRLKNLINLPSFSHLGDILGMNILINFRNATAFVLDVFMFERFLSLFLQICFLFHLHSLIIDFLISFQLFLEALYFIIISILVKKSDLNIE